jgi:cytochrome c biogenesis protein CcmG/thiol:disulfide interchange protein DsbE
MTTLLRSSLRRHPLLLGLAGSIVSLAAALGAAAAWDATHHDEPTQPEVELRFRPGDQDTNPMLAGPVQGQAAPSASFEKLSGGLGSLRQLRGRPVVLNFFGSWCVPCVKEMPDLQRVHRAFGDRVAFLGLAVTDSAKNAKAMVKRTGVTYAIGRDPAGSIATTFKVVNMPSTFLISPDGTIVASHAGALTATRLRALIETKLLQ